MKSHFTCTILATEGTYYHILGDNKHKIINDNQANPYSQLVKELRKRELEFQSSQKSEPSQTHSGQSIK